MITWNELVLAEPRLRDLEEQARAEAIKAQGDPEWSFSAYWSYTLRPAVTLLVGWKRSGADAPQLRTEEAWHAAISHLIGLLPESEGALAS
ncbi:hypothetical protein AB0G60_02995 [Streptomyces angustmyceticus]|uniref:Uncharacterized protein n=1 Tax=Streptomyces angustmyceticus TaxID=285578 RepID=A0A5J4L8N1_9ACTN|nr:hypothetical protein [Streptomyces angustmyceticus]UAL65628.1 hypothetical protein K7396_02960 [Streptomyces angustmyceticus]GES27849.1 hypothetical protein San01_03360 [Streptomyces angustmyceticus]